LAPRRSADRALRVAAAPRILDAGCGTGEAAVRLAELYPRSRVLGVDIVDSVWNSPGRDSQPGAAALFEHRSVFGLELPGQSLTNRLPPRSTVDSLSGARHWRARQGDLGRAISALHAEDYGMIHFEKTETDPQAFWNVVADSFARYQN